MRRLWSPEEDERLKELSLHSDKTQEQIAKEIGRPVRAVAVRWQKLREAYGFPTRDAYLLNNRPPLPTIPTPEINKPIKDNELFSYLKDQPRSIEDLCRRFDCAPDRIVERLRAIEEEGWVLQKLPNDRVAVETASPPVIEHGFSEPLAERHGMIVPIAVGSDVHAGSVWSQPTALHQFTREAYETYGVRAFFNPGDCTEGIYGYRGINTELVPQARPYERAQSRPASVVQAKLYDAYKPHMPDLTYFELGGNHDFWHVQTNGFDPLRYVCNRRPDMVYLGYVAADIPLTDQVTIRLWHPNRGPAYAKSYPLQKNMEAQAFADLQEAVQDERSPKSSVILAGHLHYSLCLIDLPMVGIMAGAFQAKTKFMQGKALTPNVGGVVLRFLLRDNGHVERVEYTWLGYPSIKDDWKNYPVPEQVSEYEETQVTMDALYQFAPTPLSEAFPSALEGRQTSDSRPA
jgi:transposase-like protein